MEGYFSSHHFTLQRRTLMIASVYNDHEKAIGIHLEESQIDK